MPHKAKRETAKGIVFGLAAYLIWGFFPLYFRALSGVTPAEILTHRIIWSTVSLIALVWWMKGHAPVLVALRSARTLVALTLSTLFIATNWFVFIYAVDIGRVLECSLGYYISPLSNVLFGRFLLKERLRPLQWAAIALAVLGVAVKAWTIGQLPIISLILGGSFGAYGLTRKLTRVDAVTALTVETGLLMPFACAYAVYLLASGKGAFLTGTVGINLLLVGAGIVTAIPLIFYGAAIERLTLSTVGVLQYLVPTMQFAIAVFAFNEEFTAGHAVTFILIWTGLALYTWDGRRVVSGDAA